MMANCVKWQPASELEIPTISWFFCAIVKFCFVSRVPAGLCTEHPFILSIVASCAVSSHNNKLFHKCPDWCRTNFCSFVLFFFFLLLFLLFLFTKAALVEWQNDMANDDQLWSIIWTEQCTRHNYNHVVCMWMFKLPFPWIFTKESYILFS